MSVVPARRIGVGGVTTTTKMRDLVGRVLDSEWFSPGEMCKRFEREWAALHQRRHAIYVNSGTSALHISVAALKEKHGWQTGYKVIVPALTFVASVNVLLANRLKPVFVDTDPWYGIEPVYPPPPDTVAIMPVHINGQQCDMEQVKAYADLYDLQIIEDSCETVGAKYNGKTGWGEVSCYSTYSCHHLATGVGGFATTDDPQTAALLRSLANHGRDGVYFDPQAPLKELISKRFHFERVGFSYRASEFEAAIGCAQMPQLEGALRRRRENANWLSEALEELPLVLPRARPNADWWPMFYPVLTPRRDELCEFLEANNVETRYFLPLTNQPVYRNLVNEDDFPFAKRVNEQGMYVGIHDGLSDADLSRMATLFHQFFARR